jgi:hypothetical protein
MSSLAIPAVTTATNDTSSTTFLKTVHVARYLGVTPSLLRMWRNRRIGPRFVKLPGKHGAVFYRETDVLSYLLGRYVVTDRMVKPLPGPIAGKPQRKKRRNVKMPTFRQNGVSLEGYQWLGVLNQAALPYWLKTLALHHESQGPLTLPIGRSGTAQALPGDWIIQLPDGSLQVLSPVSFDALYTAPTVLAGCPLRQPPAIGTAAAESVQDGPDALAALQVLDDEADSADLSLDAAEPAASGQPGRAASRHPGGRSPGRSPLAGVPHPEATQAELEMAGAEPAASG